MFHEYPGKGYLVTILLAILILVTPAAAYNVTVYGSGSGFDPALHTDTFTVVRSLPGTPGSDLDASVDQFTDPTVDVIVIAGDNTFSSSTAAKIESAVASGSILVVTYPAVEKFDASLPASNGGSNQAGTTLDQTDASSADSKAVFSGLPTQFTLNGTAPDREQAVARTGATTLLSYDSGTPALVYGKYGKGTVIEWTTAPAPSYMTAAQADTITYRLITRSLPAAAATTTVTTTATAATTATTKKNTSKTTVSTTETTVAEATTVSTSTSYGNVSVYSSPSGASILIDGVYSGATPMTVTDVPAGNHILRLTLSGYYDYEGTIYIVPGQTASAFGTLPPLTQASSSETPVTTPTPIVVTVTVTPTTQPGGFLDNSSLLVAIIGVVTAIIGAAVTVFTHLTKIKKE